MISKLIIINLVLSLVYYLFSTTSYAFVNSLFLFGLLYTLIGLSLFIKEKGFFDIINYSSKKFFSHIGKSRYNNEDEKKLTFEEYKKLHQSKYKMTNPLL